MDTLLAIVMRWAHVLSAIVALGGSMFVRFILLPASAAALSAEDLNRLRQTFLPRWRKVVHACIALFLVSGFYNYIVIAIPQHRGDGLYHALMGIKIILAFVVFYLAIVLTGRRDMGESLRQDLATWLNVLIALAVAVVLIAGALKVGI